MSVPGPSDLLAFLQEHGFLTPSQAQELGGVRSPKFADARALVGALVAREWLTTYQANLLLHGRGTTLLLGQYRIVDRLGEGGMAQVFRAFHVGMGRVVALKIIASERLANPVAVARFDREVRAVARLSHRNIVTAFNVGQAGGTHYLAMEYVDGIDLAKLVLQSGPLPIPNACEYIRQAAGLQHAHEQGLVHRDVKPGNLMVARSPHDYQPVLKILDFGLARFERETSQATRLTQLGRIVGTVDYIAPEQAENAQTVDIRADIYSLGCSLFYLLTGKPPFSGPDAVARIAARLSETPSVRTIRPEIPPALEGVVARMMARRPADRYQTPDEVALALQPFLEAPAQLGATVLPQPAKGLAGPEQKGSPFEGLGEAPGRKPVKKAMRDRAAGKAAPAWWRRPPVLAGFAAAAAALTVLMGLWAGGGFKGKARDGLLVVEVNEPNPEVYVDGDRMTVSWDNGGKKAEIQVKPGTRKVLVKKDGFTEFGEEVTLQEGKRRILVARLSKPSLAGKVRGVDKGWPRQIENSIGMHLVRIPPGTFTRGSPKKEQDEAIKHYENTTGKKMPDAVRRVIRSEGPQHEVGISQEFWLGVHEVTQKQFKAVMGYNPSFFSEDGEGKEGLKYFDWSKPAAGKDKVTADTGNFPVENVSWEEAKEFCAKLSNRPEEERGGRKYRLPTEAEGEYACRGGASSSTSSCFGDSLSSTQANFLGDQPHGGPGRGRPWAVPVRWARTGPTPSGFSTCTATSGSGAPTGSLRIITAKAPSRTQRVLPKARPG
jgi:formylglycine-generating enzyme required for sulfatase activity/tRNA A-37 threonylcarbamoyl transferase component Bud32